MKCIPIVFLCFVVLLHYNSSNAQQAISATPVQLREGKHNFTLQWLGWEKPGKVTISKKQIVPLALRESKGMQKGLLPSGEH